MIDAWGDTLDHARYIEIDEADLHRWETTSKRLVGGADGNFELAL